MTIVIILVGLLALAGLEGIYYLFRVRSQRKEEELRRRLASIGDSDRPVGGSSLVEKRNIYGKTPGVAAYVKGLPGAAKLGALVEQADSKWTVAQLIAISLVLLVLGTSVPLSLGMGSMRGLLLGLGAACVPSLYLHIVRGRRSTKISEQLPDALEMMSRSLRAGHATPSAFHLVATELPPPVAVEFGRAYEEQRLGLSVEESVQNITRRTPGNRDLRIFAVSISIQQETGGNLAEVLENNARTLRERFRFYNKLSALTSEGKASGFVLASLPPGVMGLLFFANPAYIGQLFTHPLGKFILITAGAMWGTGAFFINKMSKVDF